MSGAEKGWATDASGWGFGGAMQTGGVWYLFRGEWNVDERAWLDINALELLAVLFGSALFGPYRRGCRVILQTDNKTSAEVANRGKARAALACVLNACEMQWTACSILAFAQHIYGVDNTLPDVLSRPNHRAYWKHTNPLPVQWLTVPASVRVVAAAAIEAAKHAKAAKQMRSRTGGVARRLIRAGELDGYGPQN